MLLAKEPVHDSTSSLRWRFLTGETIWELAGRAADLPGHSGIEDRIIAPAYDLAGLDGFEQFVLHCGEEFMRQAESAVWDVLGKWLVTGNVFLKTAYVAGQVIEVMGQSPQFWYLINELAPRIGEANDDCVLELIHGLIAHGSAAWADTPIFGAIAGHIKNLGGRHWVAARLSMMPVDFILDMFRVDWVLAHGDREYFSSGSETEIIDTLVPWIDGSESAGRQSAALTALIEFMTDGQSSCDRVLRTLVGAGRMYKFLELMQEDAPETAEQWVPWLMENYPDLIDWTDV
jgi:hypothetical protein